MARNKTQAKSEWRDEIAPCLGESKSRLYTPTLPKTEKLTHTSRNTRIHSLPSSAKLPSKWLCYNPRMHSCGQCYGRDFHSTRANQIATASPTVAA
ncbi:hypothetical protein [Nostoc sp. FACHB-280]|uniref:hypothetical protein n=1 Tax=Nostoc sp. FACHB-280 TaxID=2692839 RepID=UPI00168C025D|nr:hypothetical protein [Nostoc sp. FACHB-280]MBD2498706.1 hypothetical protein [Nostoc sp. FACHB-280]